MRAGEFPDGARVLRAKIDMASPNLNMRDPIMYRIIHEPPHHRTGDAWCIYPDVRLGARASATPSRASPIPCVDLGFEDHRPLYDWFLDELGIYHPQQIEFARLNHELHRAEQAQAAPPGGGGHVAAGMTRACRPCPGMRRRGYTPEAIRTFCQRIGVAKANSIVDIALLEHCHPRGPEQARAARHGRPGPTQGGDRQLSRRPGRRDGGHQQPRRPERWARAGCPFPASCTSSERTFARSRRPSTTAWHPDARCGCAMPISSPA